MKAKERKPNGISGWLAVLHKRRFSGGWSVCTFLLSTFCISCFVWVHFSCFLPGQVKRTQKFIVCNSKFDMNFIYLHVNRICVTPKTFEREIYEQTAADRVGFSWAFFFCPFSFSGFSLPPQWFPQDQNHDCLKGERCSIRRPNESDLKACFSSSELLFGAAFVFHFESWLSWLYCWRISTFFFLFLFISPQSFGLLLAVFCFCFAWPAFIILNVVGHGHVGSVRLAWFRGVFRTVRSAGHFGVCFISYYA